MLDLLEEFKIKITAMAASMGPNLSSKVPELPADVEALMVSLPGAIEASFVEKDELIEKEVQKRHDELQATSLPCTSASVTVCAAAKRTK